MPIDEVHISELGLVVLDVTCADEETVEAVMEQLQQQWATSGITPTSRVPGESGVRARVYADTRRQPNADQTGSFGSPRAGQP